MSPKSRSRSRIAPEELSFEQAFAELEVIVQKLEAGQLPLDEALQLFERGQALAARCGGLLEAARLKVQQLVPGPDGEPGAPADFEPTEE